MKIKPSVLALPRSSTLAINERSAALQKVGKSVFRLGFGQSPFPVPDVVVDALREHAHEKAYLAVDGLEALRDTVAKFHGAYTGNAYGADQVLVGPGSKELLFILQLCCEAEILIPSPSWVSYGPQASIAGREAIWLPTKIEDGWRLSPDVLDEHCKSGGAKSRLLVLNYPNNPTGTTWEFAALEELVTVARAHGVIIVADEIYGALRFDGEHRSIAEAYPEGTIISNGISKWCGAGGWRLGTFVLPAELAGLREAMAVVASETFTSTSAPIQYAAIRAFENGPEIQRYVELTRKVLRSIAGAVGDRLQQMGVEVARAQGGFYVFPNFAPFRDALAQRGVDSSESLCHRLLADTGVALLPGRDFGRDPNELTTRLAFVDFDGAAVLEALQQQGAVTDLPADFPQRSAPKVMAAMDALSQWLHSGA